MSNYLVSARKYRPIRFDDVVGQGHVTTTLKNALKSDQLAQSFLFCGPRGVGKTTCARILAKALNCQNPSDDFEPCNECGSCTSFNDNASFNIFELDAASNNSVDDIRQLIEQVRFAPQVGKYKVYIIDEVHMLSPSAFNAFLKTLEEPPSYAIFILATTEKHKILPTIISRCQVFDFQRIGVMDMVTHLQEIVEQESLEAESEALHVIAQKADGGLRDALSIFDRMSSFASGQITYEAVLKNLNILDYDYYFRVTDSLLLQDRNTVLLTLDEILKNGFDGSEFITGFASHFRNLMMAKTAPTSDILELSENWKEKYKKQASNVEVGFMLSALTIANDCGLAFKTAKNKRLQLELCLLKLCYLQQAIDLGNIPAEEKKTEVVSEGADKHQQLAEDKKVNEEKEEKESPVVESFDLAAMKAKKAEATKKAKTVSLAEINQAFEETKHFKKQKLVVSNDSLQNLWSEFVESLPSIRSQSILKEHPFELRGETMFFTTDSGVKKSEIVNNTTPFIEWLKRTFNEVNILVDIELTKSAVEEERKAYTSEEKFNAMAKKNPSVLILKKELGLELEY